MNNGIQEILAKLKYIDKTRSHVEREHPKCAKTLIALTPSPSPFRWERGWG
jgi:hypothetical protein